MKLMEVACIEKGGLGSGTVWYSLINGRISLKKAGIGAVFTHLYQPQLHTSSKL